MLRSYNTACRWLYLLYCIASGNAFTRFSCFFMFLLKFAFVTSFSLGFISKCHLHVYAVCNFFHDGSTMIGNTLQ